MAGATRTTADSILKEFYEGAAQDQLNNNDGIFAYAQKNSKDIEGRRAILAPHVARNAGVGARAEGGTLPTAGAQDWDEQRIPLFFQYGSGSVTGPLMRSTKTDRGSFVRSVDAEMKGITRDLKRDVNRQVWGNADGVIGPALGVTTSSVQIALGSVTTASTIFNQLEIGMKIDIGTVAAPTLKGNGLTISAVSASDTAAASYIIVDTATTTTGTDFIFRSGSGGSGASQKEITGLKAQVASSGTLFNVVGTGPWKSTVNGNSGTNRALTEALMARVVMDVGIQSGTNDNLIGVGSPGVYRAFANLQTSLKRYTNTSELKGGWVGLEFASGTKPIPITADRDCWNNQLYFVNTQHLIEFKMSDWEFMQEDGAVLSRLSTTDAYQFTLFKYHEVATDQRNAHGLVQDITEAT